MTTLCANFVMTDETVSCHNNLRCHQWRQIGIIAFLVFYNCRKQKDSITMPEWLIGWDFFKISSAILNDVMWLINVTQDHFKSNENGHYNDVTMSTIASPITSLTIVYSTVYSGVIKWKHFPRYWSFVRTIHRPPVNSPYKGQWRGALMFYLICV